MLEALPRPAGLGWVGAGAARSGRRGAGTGLARGWHGAGEPLSSGGARKRKTGQSWAALGVPAAARPAPWAARDGVAPGSPLPEATLPRVPCLSLRCRPGSRSLPSSLSALSLFIAPGCF